MADRIRWIERLFTGQHLTLFGVSVFTDKDAVPRTQHRMQKHVDSCKKCAVLVKRFNGAINVARLVLLGAAR